MISINNIDSLYNNGLNDIKAYTICKIDMEFKDRLSIFMKSQDLSANGLAKKLGYGHGTRISRILRGDGLPSFDFIEKLAELYPSLNIDWLVRGIGDMYKENMYKIDEAETDLQALNEPNENFLRKRGDVDVDGLMEDLMKSQIDFVNKLKHIIKTKK